MDSESDMEVVYNKIIHACICIHNILIFTHPRQIYCSIFYTIHTEITHHTTDVCTHARTHTHTCTHQPLVSICDLKLPWWLYEKKSSQGISHAMVEFRNCLLLSIIVAWYSDRVYNYKYRVWPHHSSYQFLIKEAETVSEKLGAKAPFTGWLLETSLYLFLDGSSRHIYIYIYIYIHTHMHVLFGTIKHWTSVHLYISNLY
jgi:hypothetical protein